MNRFLRKRKLAFLALAAAAALSPLAARPAFAEPSLGMRDEIVAAAASDGAMPLVQNGQAAPIFVDANDERGVVRVATDLQADIERVTKVKPELVTDRAPSGKAAVVIGTLGKSKLVDALVAAGKIDVSAIKDKWESFVIATVAQPMPGVDQALVIVGSDRRGTIYGTYEISEQSGVSPWYWWADVPPKQHDALFAKPGVRVQGPPGVKYRGIFINDEEPALGGWTREKFGGYNSKMYVHMFELILRMRGNYLWPAMWSSAFNADPNNPRLADEYGVFMGTSHHEPMMRSQQEWNGVRRNFGNEWDYAKNEEGLKRFWTEGVARNKNYDNLYTMGMRGDGDMAMPDAGGLEANKKLLEKIIADQQQILRENVNPDVKKIPQLWALFTEVQQYYDAGLKLPEEVTMLFTDDNVGNLRRVPSPSERDRAGGAGVYFHMDMNGGPFSYKWLNSNPLPKVWEQMNLAYEYGSRQIWIVNVGDLKPLEVPLEFFLRMGYDPKQFSANNIADYQLRWAEREFGKEHAAEIADLVAKYAKYNAWRKPELIRPETFSLVNYNEADRVLAAWDDLDARASVLNDKIPAEQKDAYYQLVLHPIRACANFVHTYVAAGRNALYAKQGRASANDAAKEVADRFKKDQEFSDYYNKQLAGGKWNHMMDQTHFGYTSWQSPQRNIIPKTTEVTPAENADFGVAVEGSTDAWPGGTGEPSLTFDSIAKKPSYVEVFARGTKTPEAKVTADQPWITVAEDTRRASGPDKRYSVSIDWDRAPAGQAKGSVTVEANGQRVAVAVNATKATDEQAREAKGAFGTLVGPISFLAADAAKNTPAPNGTAWKPLPDYGRGPAAMTIFPVTAESAKPPTDTATLEYPIFVARPGDYSIDILTSPTLKILPARGLALAVAIDDGPPQTVDVFGGRGLKDEDFLGRFHLRNTGANARTMQFTQTIDKPGRHTLKVMMVDPTVVLQKIMIHDQPLPPSYFGPPEQKPNP